MPKLTLPLEQSSGGDYLTCTLAAGIASAVGILLRSDRLAAHSTLYTLGFDFVEL